MKAPGNQSLCAPVADPDEPALARVQLPSRAPMSGSTCRLPCFNGWTIGTLNRLCSSSVHVPVLWACGSPLLHEHGISESMFAPARALVLAALL